MMVSYDQTQNLYNIIFCITALTAAGVIHLIKRHREKKKIETEFLDRQRKRT